MKTQPTAAWLLGKNKVQVTFFTFLMAISTLCLAQPCDKLLADGLYSITKMTNTNSFSKDLRTYYMSEAFKSDMKNGTWGASVTVPIDGVPFSIGANDSDAKYSELRTKLLSITELKIDQTNVQVLLQSTPNTNLYQAYVDCLNTEKQTNLSGFIQGTNVETEDAVVFAIHYKPSSPLDQMPIVKSFNVIPEGSVISGGLTIGQSLQGFTTLVTCRRPLEKDLVLTLQTDRGAISSKALASDNITSNKELPIGTIIASYLNFEQFNAATINNEKSATGVWSSSKSKWAPCDGRPIPMSKFQTVTSQLQVPDLRGMFLRGLNTFDPFQPVPAIASDKADPENRVVGSFQVDNIKAHNHTIPNPTVHAGSDQGPDGGGYNAWGRNAPTSNVGGAETRPKNIAIFYYIKIN